MSRRINVETGVMEELETHWLLPDRWEPILSDDGLEQRINIDNGVHEIKETHWLMPDRWVSRD